MDYLQYWIMVMNREIEIAVLNLVINGLPSIPSWRFKKKLGYWWVLNLVINGLPSIRKT